MIRSLRVRRHLTSTLILVCALVLASSCVKLPRQNAMSTGGNQEDTPETVSQQDALATRININTASVEELEKLPGIGPALAARIVAHREQYGRFRRAEHLIMVRGIGDRRFRKMRAFITVE
jgi:competence protein ComEA